MVMLRWSFNLTTLFFLSKLSVRLKAVNQYSVHILSLSAQTTALQSYQCKEEKAQRKYFKINPHKSMGLAEIKLTLHSDDAQCTLYLVILYVLQLFHVLQVFNFHNSKV